MIAVACPKCGASQTIHAASVPPGGKLLKCSECKRLVRITKEEAELAAARTAKPAEPKSSPDLPAPKRTSPAVGDNLPAPVGARRSERSAPPTPGQVPGNLPAPVGARGREVSDLPAPVGARERARSQPPRRPGTPAPIPANLPAPVGTSARDVSDLPAPVGVRGRAVSDLPAPVGVRGRAVSDLPAPVGVRGRAVSDLPAPVGPRGRSSTSRPGSSGAARAPVGRPVGQPIGAASDDEVLDLLTPLSDEQIADRPVAVARPLGSATPDGDLAPVGFFDDLPAPTADNAGGDTPGDLAPRGFFDDVPMPAENPNDGGDALAPRGFFDDISMPFAGPSGDGLLAPKDDFDLGAAGVSGSFPAQPYQPDTGGASELSFELGASGSTAEHAAHDVGDVPDLELGSSGSMDVPADVSLDIPLEPPFDIPLDASLDIPLDIPPEAPVDLGSDHFAQGGEQFGSTGLELALDPVPAIGLDLDPAPGLALDPLPDSGLEPTDSPGSSLLLDDTAMPNIDDDGMPGIGLALDVPELSEPTVGADQASVDDGLVDFSAAFESGLRISETDFSSYTNPGRDLVQDAPVDSIEPLDLGLDQPLDLGLDPLDGPLEGSPDAFADLSLDPLDDSASMGIDPLGAPLARAPSAPAASVAPNSDVGAASTGPDMALELGFDLPPAGAPAQASAGPALPSISLTEMNEPMAAPSAPALPSISLPSAADSAPGEASVALSDGLDFDLPEPSDDAAQPLLDIGLPDPSLQLGAPPVIPGRPGQPRADSEMELSLSSAGGSARSEKAAQLERALGDDEPEDAPSLALDADIVAQVESTRRAVSDPNLAVAPEEEEDDEELPDPSRRRRLMLVAVAVIGVGALGAGGFFGFKYFKGKKDREAAVQKELDAARQHMRSSLPGHWEQAGQAAERGLRHNGKHNDALGIAAQAYLAAYLDEGTNGPKRVQKGRQLIGSINQHSASGPQVDKARALLEIIEYRPDRAIPLLESATRGSSAPDPDALLYAGWALADSNKPSQAEAKFAQALAAAPGRPTPAMYGLGLAQLKLGKRKNALNNFEAVLENDPDHLGALIGRAQAVDVKQFSERETMFLAIVKRDNLDKAPPKLVAKAWSLAGGQALEAGRLADAKERYEKAIEASKRSVDANLGLAKVALGLGELEAVRKPLEDILKNQSNHLEAKLLLAELSVKEGDMQAAEEHVKKLLQGEKNLENKLDRARIHTLNGQILTARADADPPLPKADQDALLEKAIEAYKQARELAGESEVRIAVALAELLTRTERAEEAGAILTPIKDQAKSDASLSVLLGLVYAKAKDVNEAEIWFRSALALNPNDTESRFQLGLALDAQGRVDEALSELEAAFAADKKRTDIGAELANIYESKNRDQEAAALYEELLGAEERTVVLLMRAGLFFVRTGTPDRAKKLAEGILAAESTNPAGLYIMGESLYGDGDFKNALRRFRDAAGAEQNPRYLEALGRAAEQLKFEEEALRSFREAAKLDPNLVAARIGEARVLIGSRSYEKASEVLTQVLDRWPKSADAYHYIGVIERRQDELKPAVKNFERALRYDPQRAETFYELGQAYYDLDKQRRAARALTSATRMAKPDAPWLAAAYLNLGYAERSRDNRRAAIKAWDSYLQQNPTNQAQVREIKKLLMRLKAR